jgi:hypothetical protein
VQKALCANKVLAVERLPCNIIKTECLGVAENIFQRRVNLPFCILTEFSATIPSVHATAKPNAAAGKQRKVIVVGPKEPSCIALSISTVKGSQRSSIVSQRLNRRKYLSIL